MQRRAFVTLIGGAAFAWPLAARAQQPERVRRIGVLMAHAETDPEYQDYLAAFREELHKLGWTEGRNIQIDTRWGALDDAKLRQQSANELIALQPDLIITQNTPPTATMLKQTRTIPVIFVIVADPVGSGFVSNLARPGGNATGFMIMEPTIASKWLELLKEIAPGIKRAAIMFNPNTAPGGGSYHLPSFNAAARSLNVEPITAAVHDDAEIEASITSLGPEPGGGLVVMADAFMWSHRARAISLAGRNKIPDIYPAADAARDGCLLTYGPDFRDVFRRAAPYVDHILRGAKPAPSRSGAN